MDISFSKKKKILSNIWFIKELNIIFSKKSDSIKYSISQKKENRWGLSGAPENKNETVEVIEENLGAENEPVEPFSVDKEIVQAIPIVVTIFATAVLEESPNDQMMKLTL